MAHHLAPFCRPEGARCLDKLLLAQREELRAHQPRHLHPAEAADHDDNQEENAEFRPDQLLQRIAEQIDQQQQQWQWRQRQKRSTSPISTVSTLPREIPEIAPMIVPTMTATSIAASPTANEMRPP